MNKEKARIRSKRAGKAGRQGMRLAKRRGGRNGAARMQVVFEILKKRQVRFALGLLALVGVLVVLAAWKAGVDLAVLKGWWTGLNAFLVAHPVALFVALVFLPALPIPTSALLFTAGVVWRERPVMACGLCLLAMALNMCWTYWAAARPGHGLVRRLMSMLELPMPELPKGNDLRAILLLRLTPGFPFFVQNYLLGFFRVSFRLYLPLSIACSGMISVGMVLSGAGLADGNLVPVLTGVGLIAAGGVLTHTLRGWLAKRKGDAAKVGTVEN